MTKMKGLELPLNMIVIVIVAVLVLLVVVAFFTNIFGGGTDSIRLQTAFSSACSTYKNVYNCENRVFTIEGLKITGVSGDPTFDQLCTATHQGTPREKRTEVCDTECGCPFVPTP